LPKIVTSKLVERQVRPDAASHPDADLLTAFVERSLPDRERGVLLSHLAGCAPCREIIALAQPVVTDATAVFAVPKSSWSSGLFLRWGVLAACVVVAVSLVVNKVALHKKDNQTAIVAEQRTPEPPPASIAVLPADKAAPAAKREFTLEKKSDAQPAITESLSSRNEVPRSRTVLGAPLHPGPSAPMNNNAGYIANNSVSRNDAVSNTRTTGGLGAPGQPDAQLKAQTTPARTPLSDSTIGGAFGALIAKQDAAREQDQISQSDRQEKKAQAFSPVLAAPLSPPLAKEKIAAKASSETVEVTVPASAQVSANDASSTTAYAPTDKDEFRASAAPMEGLARLSAAHQAATWQITDAGNLQRSFDGGKTWESVSVNQPAKLRVVTTAQFQVWVGGNGGLLFHSLDGGNHFALVKVRHKHATLSGDIVTLAFQDAQHGRLETASHAVWTTTDGGQHWRQP
jgi:hypothetical protein